MGLLGGRKPQGRKKVRPSRNFSAIETRSQSDWAILLLSTERAIQMIICCCTGTTDREIRRVAAQSPQGSPDGLCSSAAGRCCGGCADKVRELVAQATNASQSKDTIQAARS